MVERQPPLQVGVRVRKVAGKRVGTPVGTTASHSRNNVIVRFANLAYIRSELFGPFHITPIKVVNPLAEHDWQKPMRANQFSKLACANKNFSRFRSTKAFHCEHCPAQGKSKIELVLLTPKTVRQAGQHLQPLPQLGDRLRHRRGRQRLLTGLQPITNCLFREPSFRAVLS